MSPDLPNFICRSVGEARLVSMNHLPLDGLNIAMSSAEPESPPFGVGSHTSPIPSLSVSSCPGFETLGPFFMLSVTTTL